jgi:type III pantothenate kinase
MVPSKREAKLEKKFNFRKFALFLIFLMKLILDFGNTIQKLARFEGKQLLEVTPFYNINVEDLDRFIKGKGPFSASLLSSVIPVEESIRGVLRSTTDYTDFTAITKLPVTLKYLTPETLGQDRIAAAAAAAALWPGDDVLTIDAGTCITYDFTSRDREYLGGAISPGISMRLKALHTFTGKLPLIGQEPFDGLIGNSTRESILSGVMNGVAVEVNGTIHHYRELYPGLVVAITGGDHQFLYNRLKNNIFAVPELVLIGLNEILDHHAAFPKA